MLSELIARKQLLTIALALSLFLAPKPTVAEGWSAIGGGLPGWAHCVTTYNRELVAGGEFGALNYLARFDGNNWVSLGGGVDGEVDALTVFNGALIVAGRFVNAGGVPCNYIARWDGQSWTDLEGGMNSYVVALTVYDGELIAGGYFTTANVDAAYIAKWDGNTWAPLGSGMSGREGQVMALNVWNNQLIAAGFFDNAGGVQTSRIASWDGRNWSALGTGIDNVVYSLVSYSGLLIAGGLYNRAGDVQAHDVAAWDGQNWSALGEGVYGGVYGYCLSVGVYGNKLVAGGIYTNAGMVEAANIAEWDGQTWAAMGSGMSNQGSTTAVFALHPSNNGIVAAGIFADAGGVGAGNIAYWEPGNFVNHEYGDQPATTILYPNYPNPFNSGTMIRFQLARPEMVRVNLRDAAGRMVLNLADGYYPASEITLPFVAGDIPSGTYFYEIVTSHATQSGAMRLMR